MKTVTISRFESGGCMAAIITHDGCEIIVGAPSKAIVRKIIKIINPEEPEPSTVRTLFMSPSNTSWQNLDLNDV